MKIIKIKNKKHDGKESRMRNNYLNAIKKFDPDLDVKELDNQSLFKIIKCFEANREFEIIDENE